MKRLSLVSFFLLLILFISCQSTELTFLQEASSSDDINERIDIYINEIENGNGDMRAYYNLSYLYLYQEDFDLAEKILLEAIGKYPREFRLYTALEYLYQRTREEEKELQILYRMLDLSYADESVRSRIIELYLRREDPRSYEIALETIRYYPENQMAINALSNAHPFFISRAIINSTLDDIASYDIRSRRNFESLMINPRGYSQSFFELNNGELRANETSQSQAE